MQMTMPVDGGILRGFVKMFLHGRDGTVFVSMERQQCLGQPAITHARFQQAFQNRQEIPPVHGRLQQVEAGPRHQRLFEFGIKREPRQLVEERLRGLIQHDVRTDGRSPRTGTDRARNRQACRRIRVGFRLQPIIQCVQILEHARRRTGSRHEFHDLETIVSTIETIGIFMTVEQAGRQSHNAVAHRSAGR